MGRKRFVLEVVLFAVLILSVSAFAFQDDGAGQAAKVTKQKFLSDFESRSLLERSPAWDKFKQDFGSRASVTWNFNSNTPHRIVTSGLKLTRNLSDSNIKQVSDDFIEKYSDLLGANLSDLTLQTAGFHGKMWYVIYDRSYNGLPVYNARVNLTFHKNGNLVSFGSDTYPGIKIDTTPVLSENEAVDIVKREAGSISDDNRVLSSRLLVLPLELEESYSVHLAWEIVYFTFDPLARWFMYVDAHTGEVLMYWNAIDYAFTGNVNGDAQLDGAYDSFVNLPFKDLTVSASGHGSDVTDASGNYSISGSGSATISAQLAGTYLNVNRADGGDASFSGSSSGSLNINWTSISQPQERDAYYNSMVVHDYINYVDPSFTGMDWQLPCYVNVSGSCNAYWDGTSINFYAAGGSCPNIAQMSTVVYHEYGHGITETFYDPVYLPYSYETGGLNEGWSDFIASCITDQPLMGRGWNGSGTYLRSSDNTAQYPGSGCGGEPHCMGDIMVGALWDMRVNLIATHGASAKPYVDSLWHYARYAKPITYLDYLWELLLYDDDDGNPLNGTPNYADICDGFAQHNMFCPAIQAGVFITHTPLDNTPSTSDYQVDASIMSTEGNITSATVYWSNGGGFNPVSMSNIGGDNWRGFIPGQPMCTTVDYYITAADNAANTGRDPETGNHSFFIGFTTTMFSDDIESGTNGWTHSAVSGSVDEWAIRNHRNHTSGGSNAWKLGSSANPGSYADYEDAGLVTPSIAVTLGAELSFWMWGDIEQSSSTSAWDGALVEISVNGGAFTQLTPTAGSYTHTSNGANSWPDGTPCWSGSFGWIEVICDLSAYAGSNVRVRLRFSSDTSVSYEGWYIDDVQITSLDCAPVAIGTLSGTVTDINGPVGSVQIYANDGSGHTGSDITLSNGTYSMDLQASTYDVSYTHAAHVTVNLSGVAVVESTVTIQDAVMSLLPEANINVTPTSINGLAPVGGSDTDNIIVSNTGDATLNFTATTSVNPINPASSLAIYDGSKENAEFFDKPVIEDKQPFTGTPNIPDQNIILQGGDNIGTATVISSLPYNDTGTTSGYTDDYDEACPYTGSTSPDVVYSYTPSYDMTVDVTLCNGSSYDTKLYIYENSYTPGSPYDCNDDSCPGYVSELLGVSFTNGNTYYIIVDGYGGDFGNYVLDVNLIVPPAPITCPSEGTLYGQPPHMPADVWTAGTSDSAPAENYLRYESFSGLTSAISEITFWGLDLYFDGFGWVECSENPMPITIIFYQDNGGQPGSVVQTYSNVSVSASSTGEFYAGYEMMQYNTVLSPAVSISSGWVSIQGGGSPTCWLLWMSSGTGNASSLFWDGTSLTTVLYDMSLCLGGSGSAWLSVDISGGAIPPGQPSIPLAVTMDATSLSAGSYSGNVNISSNDPDQPSIDVPVTFIVGTQVPGTISGVVTDSIGPIGGVQVFADDGLGNTGSDVTLANGSYSLTLIAGTYSVDFSHVGHRDTTVAGVVITENNTTTLNVEMEIEPPAVIPTLNEWGMIILSLLLLAVGTVSVIRRRQRKLKVVRNSLS